MKKQIFLDHASTTPLVKQVIQDINKNLKYYANPSSKHFLGEQTKEKIEKTRQNIANFLNCKSEEIFFTSGGTEGNNLIMKGIAEKNTSKKTIIISEIEHPSVLETCQFLTKKGYIIKKIPINAQGIVKLDILKKSIDKDTLIVSIMHANNEIGTIQPIAEIAKICKQKQVYFHSDMVQTLKKIDINLQDIGLDLATFSGHKINALKGIGFVYIKKGIDLEPLLQGGGQEKKLRSGTENLTGIFSLKSAINLKKDRNKIKKARDALLKEILKIPGTILNGSKNLRLDNNINVSFYGIEGESLMLLLSEKGIYISTGSACNSNKLAESHVLKALNVDQMHINGSIRITIDQITQEELDYIIDSVKSCIKRLQEISPFKFDKEVK